VNPRAVVVEALAHPLYFGNSGEIVKPLPLLSSVEPIDMFSSSDYSFDQALLDHGLPPLRANSIQTLQVNVGKLCNQTCHHCHVDAGPTRTEIMTLETVESILAVLRDHPEIMTLDITGGAPEMNPHFEYLVKETHGLGRHIIDRCNLTVFFIKGKKHLPEFLAGHQVEIVASLPCYSEDNVDQQRGQGVFDRSIRALQQLNSLGYGMEGTGLVLNLVYNPLGPTLPPPQKDLETDYKEELSKQFGISFNQLFTITNMPISRFLDDLKTSGQEEAYLELLRHNFNPASANNVMCRNLLSVGWDGRLYDCDFNQMLELPVKSMWPRTIADFEGHTLRTRDIVTRPHCLGCTAGAGSSCGGALH